MITSGPNADKSHIDDEKPRSGERPPRGATTRTSAGRSAPSAATIAVLIEPAVAVPVVHDVRSADYTTDDATDNRARRPGNNGAGACADSDAFERSGLGCDGHRRQHQHG